MFSWLYDDFNHQHDYDDDDVDGDVDDGWVVKPVNVEMRTICLEQQLQ